MCADPGWALSRCWLTGTSEVEFRVLFMVLSNRVGRRNGMSVTGKTKTEKREGSNLLYFLLLFELMYLSNGLHC